MTIENHQGDADYSLHIIKASDNIGKLHNNWLCGVSQNTLVFKKFYRRNNIEKQTENIMLADCPVIYFGRLLSRQIQTNTQYDRFGYLIC